MNLLIGSASTKWSILASVFVPMFMLMGYSPALVQMAYRIGDAVTNPMNVSDAYFGMLLALAQKYDKKAGFGTLMSNTMPYVIAFFLFMVAELLIYFFLGSAAGSQQLRILSPCNFFFLCPILILSGGHL